MTLAPVVPQRISSAASRTNNHQSPTWTSRLLKHVVVVWNRVKISKLSKYPIERAEALDNYCQRTSLLRVVLLCALIPWPSLLLELLVECVPVNDPERGLKGNIGACFRVTIIAFSIATGTLFQVQATTPGLTHRKILMIALITGCGATMMMFGVCSWIFPFPFSVVFVGLPAGALFAVSFLLATKRTSARINPTEEVVSAPKSSLRQSIYLFVAQGVLVAVYMTFSSVFSVCTFKERVVLLLFLPVIKLSLKHMVARLVSENPESIPAVVVFTVDVFNGLYSSICIQASKSWQTSMLMIALNFSNTMISAFEINQAALLFRELDRKCNGAAQPQMSWDAAAVNSDSRYGSSSLVQSATRKTHVNPNAKGTSAGAGIIVSPLRASAAVTARTSAGLLFQLEYRALVGYIEAAIPMLYAVYLSILVHMPSAQYYPSTRSITSDQLQTNVLSILTYAATEILSLLWLHVVVKRKLGFSLLHQLSYVLETETELLQGRLFVWIVLLLQLPLVHFGTYFEVHDCYTRHGYCIRP